MENTPRRILVAEDNDALSNVIRFNLEIAGFEVSVARNGVEAKELLLTQTFDALLTDYQMPYAGGDELCRFVREDLRLADLPIVICSAKGLELDFEVLHSRWNVQRLIFKPFSLREIVCLIRNITTPPTVANA